jgi:hypothetical protein
MMREFGAIETMRPRNDRWSRQAHPLMQHPEEYSVIAEKIGEYQNQLVFVLSGTESR